MSAARRRKRRARDASSDGTQVAERASQPAPEPSQQGTGWKWRTFPVYFAFALGAFIGLYLGLIASALDREGEQWLSTGIFIAIAIMLGLGLSRLTTKWLVTRRLSRAGRGKGSG